MQDSGRAHEATDDAWYILDAIGPFFLGYGERRVNWSKIPFPHLERDGEMDAARWPDFRHAFARFCGQVAGLGYNAITLDDLAHLADSTRYPPSARRLIASYRRAFGELFRIAACHGLRILITTDVMFAHRDGPDVAGRTLAERSAFLAGLLDDLYSSFPEVGGLVVRFGEADGLDVADVFRSTLAVRTPREARQVIAALLEVTERHGRTLVVRTWSVGAYRVGDLIWNRDTFDRLFQDLHSPRLLISLKFGESDFFRFLPLNRHFFRGPQRKIIELQTRREYEGCGEYPSYIGGDYERYRRELQAGGARLAGIMVWCQTGGWTTFRRLTYVEDSSVWTEINTHVALRLFRDGMTADEAVDDWCRGAGREAVAAQVRHLLHLSEEVVCSGLYMDEISGQKLFFRRLRVPPLLWVFWDQVLISRGVGLVLDCLVCDGRRQVAQAEAALRKIDDMRYLAARAGLPVADLEFMADTFSLFAAARRFYFLPARNEAAEAEHLHARVRDYQARHARHYAVRLDLSAPPLRRRTVQRLLRLLVRRQRGYRWLDRIVTLRLLAWAYPLLRRTRLVPALAEQRAMGLSAVFR